MSADSNESTAILAKECWIVEQKVFWTPKIDLTRIRTWIIQMTVKTTGKLTINVR